jgi:hypothetical protein
VAPADRRQNEVNGSPSRRGLSSVLVVAVTLLGMAGLVVLGASPAGAEPNLPAPYVEVTASGATIVGLQVFANVNLAGGSNPTGTLTFWLFGVNDAQCAQGPIFTSTVAVAGTSMNSDRFTTSAAGTYRWQVSYSGDANNAPVPPSACAAPGSAVVVQQAQTALGVYAAAPLGGSLWATGHIGGLNPTGTITFYLTPPGDMFCSTPPVFTSTVAVNGIGNYVSGRYQYPVGGQYKWRATYSGDANNMGGTITSCLDANAAVIVPPFAAFTYPRNGATNVDPTAAFTWTPAAGASGYFLTVGTTQGGWDLAWSGQLPATQTTFNVGALPSGLLYAAIYTMTNGIWNTYQAITFTAAPNEAGLTTPTNGQANLSTTTPISWTTVPGVSGYALWVGTTYGGADLLGTGLLPATQSSLTPPTLPAGKTLYIIMFTLHHDGTWSRQAVTFSTGAAAQDPLGESQRSAAPPCVPAGAVVGCSGP